jgi:hypothetical protein
MGETLADLLNPFRDSPDDLGPTIVIAGDLEAMRLLAVWPAIPLHWRVPKGPRPQDPNTAWDWLWKGIAIGAADLGRRAGLHPYTAVEKFEMLKGARMIFPDGTISQAAARVLEAGVALSLPRGRAPRRPPRG